MIDSLPIDHIGIAVTDIDLSIKFYTEILGHRLTHREELSNESLVVAFLENGASTIELISPLTETGAVAKFLRTRGPGMHHLCLKTSNIQQELDRLAQCGMRLIDTAPRAGARGKLIAFIHPSSTNGVLLELCQQPN